MNKIDYNTIVDRNLGLLNEREQALLKESPMALLGLGGLGGVIAQVLVRAGVANLSLVDHDRFEPTNLNRQVFAFDETLGMRKTEATEVQLKKINPALVLRSHDSLEADNIGAILKGTKVVLLAIDQAEPCIIASRAARERDIPLVEGWAIPFANVRVFTKDTPTLEEVYGLHTAGKPLAPLAEEDKKLLGLKMLEELTRIEGVGDYYPPRARERIARGETPSFAPFVWLTAVLMALEAVKVVLGWGRPALAPGFALYDPVRHAVPRQGD